MSSSTTGATAAHYQIDSGGAKTFRQLHIDFRYRFVKTEGLPARLAGEMRVMPMLAR